MRKKIYYIYNLQKFVYIIFLTSLKVKIYNPERKIISKSSQLQNKSTLVVLKLQKSTPCGHRAQPEVGSSAGWLVFPSLALDASIARLCPTTIGSDPISIISTQAFSSSIAI